MAPKSKSKAKAKGKGKPKLTAEELEMRNKIKEDFRAFDLNGDGQLQRGELKALLHVLDPDAWTGDAVDRLIVGFDKDGDGDISLDEFVDWITGVSGDAHDEEHEAFAHTLSVKNTDKEVQNCKHARQELEHLKGVNIEKEAQAITDTGLAAIAKIEKPCEPLERMFAVVYLILQPSTTKASGKPVSFTPPSWPVVQHLLQDSSFIQRVGSVDKRRDEMRVTHSLVAGYAVENFFSFGEELPAPLSYDSLLEASHSHKLGKSQTGPVMVLYKWCLALLEANLRVLAKDKLRAAATTEFREEQQQENRRKDQERQHSIALVAAEAEEVLANMDKQLSEL